MFDFLTLPMLTAIVVFCTLCLGMMSLYRYVLFLQKKKTLLAKIEAAGVQWSPTSSVVQDESDEAHRFSLSWLSKTLRFLGVKAYKGLTEEEYTATKLKFLQAGISHPQIVPLFWGVKLLLSVTLVTGLFVGDALFHVLLTPMAKSVAGLSLAIVGFYLPELWLTLKRKQRANLLERGFPDALDLLVVCVEAGMGLDGAIGRVAKEIRLNNPALSQELRTVIMEIKAGKSRQVALNNFAERTNLDEVKNFVGLIVQTLRFGTSVADTLRIYSDTFRTTRRQRAEEKAAKLPLKLVFPCALFIFPALFVVILGPAFIQIFNALVG